MDGSNPFVVTSNQATTAPIDLSVLEPIPGQPEPSTEMHVDPYKAAKEARHKIREVIGLVRGWVTQAQDANANATGNPIRLRAARQYFEDAKVYNTRVRERVLNIKKHVDSLYGNDYGHGGTLDRLEAAIKTRRASDGLAVVQELRGALSDSHYHMGYLLNAQKRLASRLDSVVLVLDKMKQEMEAEMEAPASTPAPSVPQGQEAAVRLLEELHVLIQGLPTIPNAPLAPAENTLRAMATLLKNGGFLNEKKEVTT